MARGVSRSVRRYVRNVLDRHVEDKFQSYNIADAGTAFGSVGNAWQEFSVGLPAQGLTGATRVGRRIRLKYLKLYGIICQGSSGALLDDAYNATRIVVALWSGTSGTTPLQTSAFPMGYPLMKMTSLPGNGLIRKYLDRYIALNSNGTEKGQGDGYVPGIRTFKWFKRFTNLYINFADDTYTYPDKRLQISMISDSSANPNPGFVTGHIVLCFEDA